MKRRNRKKLSRDELAEAQDEMSFFLEREVMQIFPEAKGILPKANMHAFGKFIKYADSILAAHNIKKAPL